MKACHDDCLMLSTLASGEGDLNYFEPWHARTKHLTSCITPCISLHPEVQLVADKCYMCMYDYMLNAGEKECYLLTSTEGEKRKSLSFFCVKYTETQ